MQGQSDLYIRIPYSVKLWLQDYANRLDVTMKDVVLHALEEYQERHDPPELRPRGK